MGTGTEIRRNPRSQRTYLPDYIGGYEFIFSSCTRSVGISESDARGPLRDVSSVLFCRRRSSFFYGSRVLCFSVSSSAGRFSAFLHPPYSIMRLIIRIARIIIIDEQRHCQGIFQILSRDFSQKTQFFGEILELSAYKKDFSAQIPIQHEKTGKICSNI